MHCDWAIACMAEESGFHYQWSLDFFSTLQALGLTHPPTLQLSWWWLLFLNSKVGREWWLITHLCLVLRARKGWRYTSTRNLRLSVDSNGITFLYVYVPVKILVWKETRAKLGPVVCYNWRTQQNYPYLFYLNVGWEYFQFVTWKFPGKYLYGMCF